MHRVDGNDRMRVSGARPHLTNSSRMLLSRERPGRDYRALIAHVKDRPGHDRRYAIDPAKIRGELGWQPAETFDSGIAKTVRWYLDNAAWLSAVQSHEYQNWISLQYAPA